MSLLREVRRIYTREHPVFLRDMSPLRAAISRPAPTPTGKVSLSDAEFADVFERAYSVAHRMLGSVRLAFDAAVETVALFMLVRRRRWERPDLDAWVTEVATNCARDQLRAEGRRDQGRRLAADVSTDDPGGASAAQVDAARRAFPAALRNLVQRALADVSPDELKATLRKDTPELREALLKAIGEATSEPSEQTKAGRTARSE